MTNGRLGNWQLIMPNTCARGIKLPYQRKPSKRVATAKAKELTDNTDQEWRECIQARWKNKKERKSKDWKSGEMMASIVKKMENISVR